MIVTPADSKQYDAILKTIGRDAIDELDYSSFIEEAMKDTAERPARRSRGEKSEKPKSAKKAVDAPRGAERADSKRRASSKKVESTSTPVVGMGDHVPAFILRAVAG